MMLMLRDQESDHMLSLIEDSRHDIHSAHHEITSAQDQLRAEQESRAGQRKNFYKTLCLTSVKVLMLPHLVNREIVNRDSLLERR